MWKHVCGWAVNLAIVQSKHHANNMKVVMFDVSRNDLFHF